MNTHSTIIKTRDGEMECYISYPDGDGPFPGIIFYMDIPGIRDELITMSERIAAEGYYCVLPDLYYRDGRVRFDLEKGEDEIRRMFAQGQKLTMSGVMNDTGAILEHLKSSITSTLPAGCIGYCMSGQYVVAAAGRFPEAIRAVASLYGVRIVTDNPNSPHKQAKKMKVELYLGFAEKDPYVEDFVVPTLKSTLEENKVSHVIEVHPNTEHGFCFPERPTYNFDAAESVWLTTLDLFHRNLSNK